MNAHSEFETPAKDVTNVPAIGITIQHQMDDNRSLVFQSFVAADCEPDELNGMLDKLRRAAERQKAIAALPTYKGVLAERESELKRETEILFGIETERDLLHSKWSQANSGRRTEKLMPQQKQEQDRLAQNHGKSQQNIIVLQKQILSDKIRIADMEAKIAEGG